MYSPLVRPGGLIAFHDIVPDHYARFGKPTSADAGGVPKFWTELKELGHQTTEFHRGSHAGWAGDWGACLGWRFTTMKVSLVIPSYNGAQFIGEALMSVMAQTVLPEEVIVVDDYSTDKTPNIVEKIALNSPVPINLVRLHRNSGGPGRPMNVGVETAMCELITMLDQDDILLPQRIEWQGGLLERHPECALVCGLSRCLLPDGSITDQYSIPADEILHLIHRETGDAQYVLNRRSCYEHFVNQRNFATGASRIVFRKSVWKLVGGFDESDRLGWDAEFSAQCCRAGDIGFVNRIVSYHRLHGTNLSSSALESVRNRVEYRLRHLVAPTIDADLSPTRCEIPGALAGLAWIEAREGHLWRSISTYMRSVRFGGSKTQAALGILKAFPHWSLSLVNNMYL